MSSLEPFLWIVAILALIVFVGWLRDISGRARLYSQLKPRLDTLVSDEARLRAAQTAWTAEEQRRREALSQLAREKTAGFPWLANAWADYLSLRDREEATMLTRKRHPAPKAAETVREVSAKRRLAERAWRVLRYQLEYYEVLFPWLADYKEEGIDDLIRQAVSEDYAPKSVEEEDEQHEDAARKWLTTAEYQSLSTTEKYQLALERYRTGRKSKWELGRDYERFIGYRYEAANCRVYYQGIVEGFADLGRDLVVTHPDGRVEIVQCKYWSQERQIHEKHIFQLYGTVIAYSIDQPQQVVSGTFVTSTSFSDRARACAEILSIKLEDGRRLDTYPCIKCNVSHLGQIYHLPFDQQYDRTMIVAGKGEKFVSTIAEAESLGFRRAMRWRGQTTSSP